MPIFTFFFILITFQLTDSSPVIKRFANRNNVVISAKIGETVNISCYFDPRLMQQASFSSFKRKRSNYLDQTLYRTTRQPHVGSDVFDNFKYNDVPTESFPLKYEVVNEKIGTDIKQLQSPPISYEIDWFFLDNQGRMNIISYGEETTSKYKYKTFFNSPRSIESSHDSEFSYSSSALYSQYPQSQQGAEGNGEATYYLSALIESEDDEGVYQCINPFKPNYVIQNTTVLISRNHSRRLQSQIFGQYFFFSSFLIVFKELNR